MKSDLNLMPLLKDFGVYDVFDRNTSDLSNITKLNADEHLYVRIFKQKTKIEVNESGTKAAAATVAVISFAKLCRGCHEERPKIIPFHADHPFVFMIVDNKTNNIIFMGQYVSPLNIK